MLRTILTLFVTVFLISAYAAKEAEQSSQDRPVATFVQQAVDACKSKHEGDSCTFTGPRGMGHEGTCHERPRDGSMICIPKPPKIAVDACTGKKEGDSCSFAGANNNTITGSCLTPPHDKSALACRPSRPSREGQK